MRKDRRWMGLVTLALLALIVYVLWDAQRTPDPALVALERLPEGCEVRGVWRRTDYPPAIEHLRNTIVLCEAAEGRFVHTIYDDGASPTRVQVDAEGRDPQTTDQYTVNADGSLTISDEQGEIITLPPN